MELVLYNLMHSYIIKPDDIAGEYDWMWTRSDRGQWMGLYYIAGTHDPCFTAMEVELSDP